MLCIIECYQLKSLVMKDLKSKDLSLNLKKVSKVSDINSSSEPYTHGICMDTKDECKDTIETCKDTDDCGVETLVDCASKACQTITCSMTQGALCCELSDYNCPPLYSTDCKETDICILQTEDCNMSYGDESCVCQISDNEGGCIHK